MKVSGMHVAVGATIALVGIAISVTGMTAVGYGGNGSAATILATSVWYLVGALIVVLRPDNAVGWLFAAIGLAWTSGLTLSGYAEHRDEGALLTFASWYSEWFWIAGMVMMVATLFVFPTGHVPSRGWRPFLAVVIGTGVAAVTYAALDPRLQATDAAPVVSNPIGIGGLRDLEETSFGAPALLILALSGAIAGVVSLVTRYRRSVGVERQQLKWVALAGPVSVLGWFAAGVLDSLGYHGDLPYLIPFLAIPVAAGIAILRHQLFDVDQLISKTLVYGALSILLGVGYVGLVLAGQALFSSFAGGSNLAIAVSTLVVAALFLPVRARVQHFVDRRFYRRRYDAQHTLEAFGTRLREQVELETLTTDLALAVRDTMQPTHVTVWLRAAR